MYTLLVWTGSMLIPKAWFASQDACNRLAASVMDAVCQPGYWHFWQGPWGW